MSTALATKPKTESLAKPSAINLMASRLSVEPTKLFETLKATVFAKATNEEMMALIVVANEYGLNPFLKELYAFPAKGGGIMPIVSVDGWNKMLVRQPDFDGIEFESLDGENGELISCTATIYVKNRSHPVKITEYLVECKRNTDPWNNMPRRMLRNRTLCQASRVAFGFSGMMHEDEQAITVESTVIQERTPQLPPPKVIPPADGKTPQAELEALVVTAGHDFATLIRWGEGTGNIQDANAIPSFAEVPTDVCRRLLRAQTGLLKGLDEVKGGAK